LIVWIIYLYDMDHLYKFLAKSKMISFVI